MTSAVTLTDLLQEGSRRIRALGIPAPEAQVEAGWLLAAAAALPRLELRLRGDATPDEATRSRFEEWLERRAEREPVQYILGSAAFRDIDLRVDPRVLVPRPETEQLVEAVLAWSRRRVPPPRTVLELGTGSGAIALSLAREGRFETIVATDSSLAALAVAAENLRACVLEGLVRLREGGGWRPVSPGDRFDVIVSNPPYVPERGWTGLAPEVRDWEPYGALCAGPDGLDVIRDIVAGAAERLCAGGLLALEVGSEQTGTVSGWLVADAAFEEVEVRCDLAGRPRLVLAERRGLERERLTVNRTPRAGGEAPGGTVEQGGSER